jgi:SAM-dependent methyltransferase
MFGLINKFVYPFIDFIKRIKKYEKDRILYDQLRVLYDEWNSVKCNKFCEKQDFFPGVYHYLNSIQLHSVSLDDFENDLNSFIVQNDKIRGDIRALEVDAFPILSDKEEGAEFDRHYIYHTAWAARVLSIIKPAKHIDISSSLYFSSILSAFIPIEFYDYRAVPLNLSNLKVGNCNLTNLFFKDNSLSSVSCMHVLEHIGLGRYGDKIDPVGDLQAVKELQRVLAPGGFLLIAVPVGRQKVMFNAHRIYDPYVFINYFDELVLKEFTLISDGNDHTGLLTNPSSEIVSRQNYGCGCFLFQKQHIAM